MVWTLEVSDPLRTSSTRSFSESLWITVAQVASPDVAPGQVAEVVQEGYLLGDAVLRPARVVVAK